VLWALSNPVGMAGLLAGFLLAMVLRGAVQRRFGTREPAWSPAQDFDVFGAVAAALGGTGWGRRAKPTFGRPGTLALVAGPLAVIAASQLGLLAFRLVGGVLGAERLEASLTILRDGAPGVEQLLPRFVLCLAVALLYAGLLALLPIPPLDGWELVARRYRHRPSQGFARTKHYLDEQNLGVVILLVCLVLPIGSKPPVLLFVLDVVTTPVFTLWAGGAA
jgi:Zn-dependent protease